MDLLSILPEQFIYNDRVLEKALITPIFIVYQESDGDTTIVINLLDNRMFQHFWAETATLDIMRDKSYIWASEFMLDNIKLLDEQEEF